MHRREFIEMTARAFAASTLVGCAPAAPRSGAPLSPPHAPESRTSELVVIRHGETEWSRAGRRTGRADIPLTPKGEEQARALAPWLSHRTIAHVFVSPLARARATAELAGLGTRGMIVEPNLIEWDYGAYEGRTQREILAERPHWDLWTDGVPPSREQPGESVLQVAARIDAALARIRPMLAANDGDVVVVAHGQSSRVLAARWLAQPPQLGVHFPMDAAHVSVLGFEGPVPVVRQWNASPRA